MLRKLVLGIFAAFYLCSMTNIVATASNGAGCNIVTIPKIVAYSPGWYGDPEPSSTSDEVSPGGSIALWVDSGGYGCAPYSWSVSGTGYSIDSETSNDLEIVTLNSAAGT